MSDGLTQSPPGPEGPAGSGNASATLENATLATR